MKEIFINPEIEVISYETVDIICASEPTKGSDFGDELAPSVKVD